MTTKLWKRRPGRPVRLRRIRPQPRTSSSRTSNGCWPRPRPPAVDRIEPHPYHQQPATAAFAEEHAISIEARGPLGQAKYPLFELPEVTDAAAAHGATPTQVVIRWAPPAWPHRRSEVEPARADGGELR